MRKRPRHLLGPFLIFKFCLHLRVHTSGKRAPSPFIFYAREHFVIFTVPANLPLLTEQQVHDTLKRQSYQRFETPDITLRDDALHLSFYGSDHNSFYKVLLQKWINTENRYR